MEDNFKTIAMNELKQKQGYSLEEKINYSNQQKQLGRILEHNKKNLNTSIE